MPHAEKNSPSAAPRPAPDFTEICDRFKIDYPAALPISGEIPYIGELVRRNQVVIVCGSTGSGKTTQLPKLALELGYARRGRIGCTQPRRIAANAMARRVAAETGTGFGNEVGVKVRFDDRTRPETRIKFMTDGILLAESRRDRDWREYDMLIIDEAHERSLNIDFVLGCLASILPRRPELRVLISSATLDAEGFSKFFGGAPVVEVGGTLHPIEDLWLEPEPEEELADHAARAVEFLSDYDGAGDILIFLPGEREIRDVCDVLEGRRYRNTEVLPLFGRMGMGEQQRIFSPGDKRRIIAATNVAETSITIPRIHYVIDSGLARISRYNPRTRIQELGIEMISQAAMRQRRGRCGRVSDGVCVHLYSREDAEHADRFTDPEIRRSSLAGVILQMALLHLPKLERFPLIDPPPASLIREGYRTLDELRALDEAGRLTPSGYALAHLPLDPQLGKMLELGGKYGCLPEILVLTAYMSVRDPFDRPPDAREDADRAHKQYVDERSDYFTVLNLWNALGEVSLAGKSNTQLRKYCRKNYLHFMRIAEWRNLVEDLADACREANWPCQAPKICTDSPYDLVHMALLGGLPGNIANYRSEERCFVSTGNRKLYLFPGSGLFKRKKAPEWIFAGEIVETTRVFARRCAEIDPKFLEEVAPHMCRAVYDQVRYNPESGFVQAREKLTSGGLVIHPGRRVHYGKSHPAEAREVFIRSALANGELTGRWRSWVYRLLVLLEDLANLEIKLRRPDTVLDRDAVAEHFLKVLPFDVLSDSSLRKLLDRDDTDYGIAREDAMQSQYGILREEDYPDQLVFAGTPFELSYTFEPGDSEDGIMLHAGSDTVNLVPDYAPGYLVPGYLGEKIEFLMKALPKAIRKTLPGAAAFASEFMESYRAGELFTDRPLADLLVDELEKRYDAHLHPAAFAEIELPEFLTMKIAVHNPRTGLAEIYREVPGSERSGSRVSAAVPDAAAFSQRGAAGLPGDPMPESVPIADGVEAYPAMTPGEDPETVDRAVFLRPDEARLRHEEALVRLFMLRWPEPVKYLRRSVRLSNEMKLNFFARGNDRNAASDLAFLTVERALGGELWSIRSESAFRAASEEARQHLGEVFDGVSRELENVLALDGQLRSMLRKIEDRAPDCHADLMRQRAFLLRPGFLRFDPLFRRYGAYFRAMKLRAERIHVLVARDRAKFAPLEGLIDRFHLAASDCEDLRQCPALADFAVALEETRIAEFAPEVRPSGPAGAAKLSGLWEKLHL